MKARTLLIFTTVLVVGVDYILGGNYHVSHTNLEEEVVFDSSEMGSGDDDQEMQAQVFYLENENDNITAQVTLVDVIPAGAIVDSFIIQRISGEQTAKKMNTKSMNTFEDAREEFEKAVSQGYSAGIMGNIDVDNGRVVTLEDAAGNQAFSAVVNIAPSEELSVSISYFVYADLQGTTWQETMTSINLDDSGEDVVINALSPNYPDFYPNKADIAWLVRKTESHGTIVLDILTFSSEKCCDHLFIYDGSTTSHPVIAVLSGDILPETTYVSTGREMLVDFVSDCTVNNGSFSLEFTLYKPGNDTNDDLTDGSLTPQYEVFNVTGNQGFISSLYYPIASYPYSFYIWYVYTENDVNLISYLDHNIGEADSLEILTIEGYFISSTNDYVIIANSTFIVEYFTGNSLGQYREFYLSFKPATLNFISESNYYDHFLKTPNYPEPYTSNSFISWEITVSSGDYIYIKLLDFELAHGFTFLTIYDGKDDKSTCLSRLSGYQGEQMATQTTGRYAYLTFDSTTSIVSYGFNLLYKALRGYHSYEENVITETEGLIASPNFPNPASYTGNFQYILQMPSGTVLHCKVYTHTGTSPVYIYDGLSTNNKILFKDDHGFDYYPRQFFDVISSTSSLLISFMNSAEKFLITYSALNHADVAHIFTRTDPSGVIDGPYYTGYFETDVTYEWQISIDANMEMYIYIAVIDNFYSGDRFYIYSGNSGNNTLLKTCTYNCNVNSTNSEMYLVFDTYNYWTRHYFTATYYSAAYSNMRFNTIYASTNISYNYIISPYYPSVYPDNFDYTYHISVGEEYIIEMYFEYFFTQENHDYVTIYDGATRDSNIIATLSGFVNISTIFVGSTNQASIRFSSDKSITYTGFKMIYRPKDYVASKPVSMCEVYSYLNHTSDNERVYQYIQSPGYPGKYPGNYDACWYIDYGDSCGCDDIRIYLTVFQTDFPSDVLEIYTGDQTDDSPVEILPNLNYYATYSKYIHHSSMTIHFKTDEYIEGRGFYISYYKDCY